MKKALKLLLTVSILSAPAFAIAEEKSKHSIKLEKDLKQIRASVEKIANQAKFQKQFKELMRKYRDLQHQYEASLVEKKELIDNVSYLKGASNRREDASKAKINELNSMVRDLKRQNSELALQVKNLEYGNREAYENLQAELSELRKLLTE